MKIKLKTNKDKIFRLYVELINPILKLTDKEMDVLAGLLYHYDKFKKNGETDFAAMILTFDYDTRVKIRDSLKISEAAFNNKICRLRAKNIIKGRGIDKNILNNFEDNKIIFELEVVEESVQ
jgi:hypothetical protein